MPLRSNFPPLDCLRFFEAAARNESFSGASGELSVTPAAVAHRVRTLESYLGDKLFTRFPRGVRLNRRGQTYLEAVQRIFLDLTQATERQLNSRGAHLLKLIVVEVVAAKWLLPRLLDFKLAFPEVGIEFDTEQSGIDLQRRNFDVWITFADQVPGDLPAETLFEESLVPVCSPAMIEARGFPETPDELLDWSLLYDLECSSLWSHWFASQGAAAPDLWRASGFRLHSTMIQAAVEGMGVALGHASMIAGEIEQGTLVALSDAQVAAPARYLLVTTPTSGDRPEVQAFRKWILAQASPDS